MIASVRRRGNILDVFDARGRLLCTISIGSRDELVGWTGDTVSVRRGGRIYHYDVRCRLKGTRPA